MVEETTWGVVEQLGLFIDPSEIKSDMILVEGSTDPAPNIGELLLTQFVAVRYKIKWGFFTYQSGKNLPVLKTEWYPPSFHFCWFEELIAPYLDLKLSEMAEEIYKLRRENFILAHLSETEVLRGNVRKWNRWMKEIGQWTISDLHERGGWLGGSAVYWLLRLIAEAVDEFIYPCPYGSKGRVYRVFRDFPRPIFLKVPSVSIRPPSQLGFREAWAPAPLWYWRRLPASCRKRIKEEVRKRIFSGEQKIIITLPFLPPNL